MTPSNLILNHVSRLKTVPKLEFVAQKIHLKYIFELFAHFEFWSKIGQMHVFNKISYSEHVISRFFISVKCCICVIGVKLREK